MSEPICNEAVEAAAQIVHGFGTRTEWQVARLIQSAITKACAERDAKLEKVKHFAAVIEKITEEQTELQAALVTSLNEAMMHDVLEQTEKERDALLGALTKTLEDLTCGANDSHYCPKCDNSLFNAKARVEAALSSFLPEKSEA